MSNISLLQKHTFIIKGINVKINNDKLLSVESSFDIVRETTAIVIGDRDETGENTVKVYIPRFMAGISLEKDQGAAKEEVVSFSSSKILNSVNKDIGASSVTTQNYLKIPCYLIPGMNMPRFVKGQFLRVTFADGDIKSPCIYPFTFQDQKKKKVDILNLGVPAKDNDVDPIGPDNSYFIEFNSRDKYIRLHTTNANGENNPFNFLINTKEGKFNIEDDSKRIFEWLYNDDTFHWRTDAGLDLELKETTGTLKCDKLIIEAEDEINMKTSKLNIKADKGVFKIDDLKIDGIKTEIRVVTCKIDASAKIILKTIGTGKWHPCAISVCPLGISHGKAAGITGLVGS